MRFVFKCWSVEHTSGRVTLTPLDQPELAVHASSVAAATEELTLVLDDKIARMHPRQLPRYAHPPAGEAIVLEVPVLPAAAQADLCAESGRRIVLRPG